jgi:uncharacterized protein (TIGR02646 family)
VFQWYRHDNHPVNQLLAPVLSQQTQDHCSYCDAFPLGLADNTIDHFKPKGTEEFLLEAYSWKNLYWACADCQKAKLEKFDQLLLAPDGDNYSFGRYFIYNFHTHEISPNPGAANLDQQKALTTIKIFQFNHPGQIAKRRQSWERKSSPLASPNSDDFSFRFIFE